MQKKICLKTRNSKNRFHAFKDTYTFRSEEEAFEALARFRLALERDSAYGTQTYRAYLRRLITALAEGFAANGPEPRRLQENETYEWLISPCGIGLELRRYDLSTLEESDWEGLPEHLCPADYSSELLCAREGRYLRTEAVHSLMFCPAARRNAVISALPRELYEEDEEGDIGAVSEGAVILLMENRWDPATKWPAIILAKRGCFVE